MSGEEAKRTLDAVSGLLFLVNIGENATPELKNLIKRYYTAVEMAKEALDIMDRDIKIENRGE